MPTPPIPRCEVPPAGGRVADAEAVLNAQRLLRRQLLDRRDTIRWAGARELAALLLLSIDKPHDGWQLALDFLRRSLGVERVDGGPASPLDRVYRPAWAESRSDPGQVPSLRGLAVDNRATAAQCIWSSDRPLVHPDIEQDITFDAPLREYFLSIGTQAKMTTCLIHRGRAVGLVCADRMRRGQGWQARHYDRFESVTQDVMAPILLQAQALAAADTGPARAADAPPAAAPRLEALSEAERRVCRLVAQGLSYKEIASRTNRSFSTVDHHLRSIRAKLGMRSTGRLVSLLQGWDFE